MVHAGVCQVHLLEYTIESLTIVVTPLRSYYDHKLTMLLSGRGLAQPRDAAILSYGYRWHSTIHQAIGVYMHWVILRMELEYQALGYIHQTPD